METNKASASSWLFFTMWPASFRASEAKLINWALLLLLVKNKLWLYCNWVSFLTWTSVDGRWLVSLILCSWSFVDEWLYPSNTNDVSPLFLRHKTSISAKRHCRSHLLAIPLFLTNNLHLLGMLSSFLSSCWYVGWTREGRRETLLPFLINWSLNREFGSGVNSYWKYCIRSSDLSIIRISRENNWTGSTENTLPLTLIWLFKLECVVTWFFRFMHASLNFRLSNFS